MLLINDFNMSKFFIGVPQSLQKVMIKGLAKDDRTLKDLGVVKGAKIMVVGSKLNDVLAVSTPSAQVGVFNVNSQVCCSRFLPSYYTYV